MRQKGVVRLLLATGISAVVLGPLSATGWLEPLHLALYDRVLQLDQAVNGSGDTGDVLLVTIGDRTLKHIPERWPFPRAVFAKAVSNLKKAGAKVIAIDFIFQGRSDPEDDRILKEALAGNPPVVLGATLDEESGSGVALSEVHQDALWGLATKLRDRDGVIRKSLTYLVAAREDAKGVLSWELQVLRCATKIDVPSLTAEEGQVSFNVPDGERLRIPVDTHTSSFWIRYRAHSADFSQLPFYQAWKGDFDADLVKDKVVLIGLFSERFHDVDRTPIGWMPGLTLNANAFLTLYRRDFIKDVPWPYVLSVNFALVSLFAWIASFCRTRRLVGLGAASILLFLAASYGLLTQGYLWDYALFPVGMPLAVLFMRKIRSIKGLFQP